MKSMHYSDFGRPYGEERIWIFKGGVPCNKFPCSACLNFKQSPGATFMRYPGVAFIVFPDPLRAVLYVG